MNERMRKLAEEAGIIHIHMSVGEIFDALQKFEKCAELIVREVLSVQEQLIANGHNAWHLNEPTKEHFGVE